MVNTARMPRSYDEPTPPDIFRAAAQNDADELRAAIADGQSLDAIGGHVLGMTPMHVACVNRSVDFLNAAVGLEHNPWIRDHNQRLAIDHASAQGLLEVGKKMLDRLYPKDEHGRPIMPF